MHPTIYDYDNFYDWSGIRKGPNLVCDQKSDAFSVSSTAGNGDLTNPIGLITADEVSMAGGRTGIPNRLYYLYSGTNYWTMSPTYFDYGFLANEFRVSSAGAIANNGVLNGYGVRPVINLDSSKFTFTGTGTMQDSYVISD